MRSRLIAVAEYLRARPIQLFVAGALVIVAALMPFQYVGWEEHFIGLPASIVSLVVVGGAVSGGPRVGAALAVVGGIAYDLLAMSDRWLVAGATSLAVIVLWLGAGLGVGLLGDRYRGQVARALDQAHRSRDALDRVVGATPLFHARGGPARWRGRSATSPSRRSTATSSRCSRSRASGCGCWPARPSSPAAASG